MSDFIFAGGSAGAVARDAVSALDAALVSLVDARGALLVAPGSASMARAAGAALDDVLAARAAARAAGRAALARADSVARAALIPADGVLVDALADAGARALVAGGPAPAVYPSDYRI